MKALYMVQFVWGKKRGYVFCFGWVGICLICVLLFYGSLSGM